MAGLVWLGRALRAPSGNTLAAAALFSPLRRRVQQVVDRRFNRARYNADKTVAAFAARLQDAIDLNAVRDDLTTVVDRALGPTHVSVWISQAALNHQALPRGQGLEVSGPAPTAVHRGWPA